TAVEIDKEVRKILEGCYKKAKEELSNNKEKLKLLAGRLLEKEVLDFEEVRMLVFPGTASDKSRQKA
ncbi:MAG: hypothetical protein V3S13_00820, partial [Candidatus Omnitrophota bacterium]